MALATRTVPGAPWYRQFWPWFLIGLPAVAVAGSVATLVIAVRNADSVVRDDWYASGVAINLDLERERVAADLGLAATVALEEAGIRVTLTGPASPADATLDLALHHPTHAERDRSFRLVRGADGGYRAAAAGDLRGRWNVALLPADGAWKLAGTIALAPDAAVPLAPRS